MNQHAHGLLLAVIGIIILSPDSLLLRLIDSEPYPLIAIRAAALAAFVAGYLLITHARYAAGKIKWQPLFWYGVAFGAGLLTFPLSIFSTYTANTLTIIAGTPIFAAIGAHVFLKERTAPMVWLTAFVLLIGIGIIFGGGAQARLADNLAGNLYALTTAVVLAASALIIRRHKDLPIFPGLVFGGVWVFAVAVLLANAADWQSVDARDFWLAALDGALVGLSFLFITKAARLLPPAEVGLLFLLETVLGPFWTWLFVDEVPPLKTLLASALVIVMLVWYGIWSFKRRGG